jgi:hypothetical protein
MSLRKRIERLEAGAVEPARSMWDVLYAPNSLEELYAHFSPDMFERPSGLSPVEALLAGPLPPLADCRPDSLSVGHVTLFGRRAAGWLA